jgi:hypothetical protein
VALCRTHPELTLPRALVYATALIDTLTFTSQLVATCRGPRRRIAPLQRLALPQAPRRRGEPNAE